MQKDVKPSVTTNKAFDNLLVDIKKSYTIKQNTNNLDQRKMESLQKTNLRPHSAWYMYISNSICHISIYSNANVQ